MSMRRAEPMSEQEARTAAHVRETVFATPEPGGPVFSNRLKHRALIYPIGYRLSSEIFDALANAGAAERDAYLFLSFMASDVVLDPPDRDFAYHWTIPFDDYEGYRDVTNWAPIETALYSPSSRWAAIVTGEDFVALAGSQSFLATFFGRAGLDSRGQALSFITDALRDARLGGWREDWLERLVRHIYGDQAEELLEAAHRETRREP